MSVCGEGLIERLHPESSLHDPNNPMRRILLDTVGEWLDKQYELINDLYEGVFLNSATGAYLDLHGNDLNIKRNYGESDEHYRNRLIYESLGHLTVDYLINIYGLELFVNVTDYNPKHNQLTSDNVYINWDGFLCFLDTEIKSILESKFVLNEAITWLAL